VEILFLCLLLFIGILIVKAFVWIIKAGLILLILPIKIIFAIAVGLFIILIVPATILSALTGAAFSVLPVILLLIGLVLLIKHALT
jgi:hypothetical protein